MTFLRYWPQILLSVAVAGLLAWSGGQVYRAGYNAANVRAERIIGEFAKAEAEAQAKAREAEQQMARQLAEVAERHRKELEDAQTQSEAVAADLVAGNRRLRREIAALATARVSGEAAATRELEAAVERGAELVAAAVGVGAACDATQRALIEAYEGTP